MPADPESIRAYQADHAALLTAVAREVEVEWRLLGRYDEADIARWLARVVPLVEAGETRMAALVDAHLADLLDEPVRGVQVLNPRGVDRADVYRRPFVDTWSKLKDGADWADAVSAGQRRAETLAATDMQLAMRDATAQVQSDKITGYRRVLDGNSCLFCATAATKRYTRAELLPLHPRCGCTVEPILGEQDPGRVVNRELLSALKERGPGYWKQRGYVDPAGNPIDPTSLSTAKADVAVREHGELGPVLVAKSDEFTGPADL